MLYYRIHNGIGSDKKFKFKIIDKDDNIVNDKKVLDYIQNLVIPPAYRDVTIFYESKPKILFEGFDDKGRKQQIYSQEHKKKAMKKKFCNILNFGKVLPKIEKDINIHIKDKTPTKNKIISLIIKIVMLCGFRIGNIKYQKLYNSFGISNIFKKHIKTHKDNMFISFIGKKGVLNECIIKDKSLINEIDILLENKTPKDYVFQYLDDGNLNLIKATEINDWLKSYHMDVTSKMFRTFDTNILFIEFMRKNSVDPEKLSELGRKKVVNDALKVISCQINNTPAICKKEYLHIDLLTLFLESPKKFKKYFYGCLDARTCFLNYLEDFCS
jgi:DNA topoisomerase-1